MRIHPASRYLTRYRSVTKAAQRPMLRLLFSIVMTLTTGLGVVYMKYLNRQYTILYHDQLDMQHHLKVEHDQLVRRYSTDHSQSHLREIATGLGYQSPDQNQIIISPIQ